MVTSYDGCSKRRAPFLYEGVRYVRAHGVFEQPSYQVTLAWARIPRMKRILGPVSRDEDPVLARNRIRGAVPQTKGDL